MEKVFTLTGIAMLVSAGIVIGIFIGVFLSIWTTSLWLKVKQRKNEEYIS